MQRNNDEVLTTAQHRLDAHNSTDRNTYRVCRTSTYRHALIDATFEIVGTVYSTVLIFYYSAHRNIVTPWSTSWWAMHQTHWICRHELADDVTGRVDGRPSRKRHIRGPTTKIIAVTRSRVLYRVFTRRVPRPPDMYRGRRLDYNIIMVYVIRYRVSAIFFRRLENGTGHRGPYFSTYTTRRLMVPLID